jgi:hypothetical protein
MSDPIIEIVGDGELSAAAIEAWALLLLELAEQDQEFSATATAGVLPASAKAITTLEV